MQSETPEVVVQDVMDPARADALLAALGRAPLDGDVLPPFFHHLYFWEPQPPSGLGRDGHPKVGGVIPDLGLPRRMWAGGRLAFEAPLRVGLPAERRTFVDTTAHKQGRSGQLGFVTLRHEIWQGGTLCVTEHQDLVYREEVSGTRPVPPVAPEGGAQREVRFDSTLLFRYSALTLNGHRIHYDETYARGVEGYDGLVVHGPLLAQLLMLEAGPLRTFAFRATAPLMHSEPAVLCRDGASMWVRGPDGRLCMTAELG
ncbi:MAG: acyl dehydratase [Pseudomonadota bacterium]